MRLLTLITAYAQCKRWRFNDRAKLQQHQQRQLRKFIKNTMSQSPYLQQYIDKPFAEWDYMDKSVMMDEFERINTAGINKGEAWEKALQAENGAIKSAIINTSLGEISVGLSSGTSGQRGMFLVSAEEQAQWAGIMLAKMLVSAHPKADREIRAKKGAKMDFIGALLSHSRDLLAKQRVALILRANSNLYQAIKTPLLSLQFFNLFQPLAQWQEELSAFNPTVIVAPAQVLVYLAHQVRQGALELNPVQLISGAEVLSQNDKALLQSVFAGAKVSEVYQATEGFLACSCAYGNLHLNEAYLIIEKNWLDKMRFTPIITDFSRHTQPIVRYQLEDILHIDPVYIDKLCPCGDVSTVIKSIEGRTGDSLSLPKINAGEPVIVFSDIVDRAISRCLVGDDLALLDYELVQTRHTFDLVLTINNDEALLLAKAALLATFEKLAVDIETINLQTYKAKPNVDFIQKKRRIRVV